MKEKIICNKCMYVYEKKFEKNYCPECGELHYQKKSVDFNDLELKKKIEKLDISFVFYMLKINYEGRITLKSITPDNIKIISEMDIGRRFKDFHKGLGDIAFINYNVLESIELVSEKNITYLNKNGEDKSSSSLKKEELFKIFKDEYDGIKQSIEKEGNILMSKGEYDQIVLKVNASNIKDMSKLIKFIIKEVS